LSSLEGLVERIGRLADMRCETRPLSRKSDAKARFSGIMSDAIVASGADVTEEFHD
jgi:hypothetical protein